MTLSASFLPRVKIDFALPVSISQWYQILLSTKKSCTQIMNQVSKLEDSLRGLPSTQGELFPIDYLKAFYYFRYTIQCQYVSFSWQTRLYLLDLRKTWAQGPVT